MNFESMQRCVSYFGKASWSAASAFVVFFVLLNGGISRAQPAEGIPMIGVEIIGPTSRSEGRAGVGNFFFWDWKIAYPTLADRRSGRPEAMPPEIQNSLNEALRTRVFYVWSAGQVRGALDERTQVLRGEAAAMRREVLDMVQASLSSIDARFLTDENRAVLEMRIAERMGALLEQRTAVLASTLRQEMVDRYESRIEALETALRQRR